MQMKTNRLFLTLTLAVTALAVQPLQAAETADCSNIHRDLNDRHSKIMAARVNTPAPIHEAMLWKLEDELFVALSICPSDSLMYALMGEVQLTLGQPPLAVAYGQRAQVLDASAWQGYYVAGTGFCLSGKYDACFKQLDRAVALAPDNHGLRLNLCSSQVWAGRYQEARDSCSTVINSGIGELQARAYYLRGRAYQLAGDEAAARQDLEQAAGLGFNAGQDQLQIIDPKSVPPVK
jgi:tetratricopeptide (TPR) repeat protein